MGVLIVDPSNTIQLRLVKTGKPFGDRIEVLSGISDGERYVVELVPTLVDGARVEAAP
jgi:multidrug efflux pump subunit AcrA (membrane-fusion protein)